MSEQDVRKELAGESRKRKNRNPAGEENTGKGCAIAALIFLGFFLLFAWFFRPWFQGIVFFFYKHYLVTLLLVLLAGIWVLFLHKKSKKRGGMEHIREEDFGAGIILSSLLILLLLILYPIFYSVLLSQVVAGKITYNPVQVLSSSTAFRYLPLPVVERISKDRYMEPTHRLYDFQPMVVGENFAWVAPRTPDGFVNTFRLRANGVMIIYDDGTTRLIDRTLQISEGQRLQRNINWALFKEQYFMDLSEFIYVPYEDDIFIVAPYIRWRFAFPVRYPELAGVFVVDSAGSIRRYSVEEAKDLPFIQRIFPERLARLYADAYALKHGLANFLFFHEDQTEVIDVGHTNPQPFLIPTESGLKWFTAAEPFGDAYGVFKIFITDALTGETNILELDVASMLLGPKRSISYVRRKNPEISWHEEETGTGTFVILEPRPLVIAEDLYWLLSVTTRDFAEISYSVLINAATKEVTRVPSLEDLRYILAEGLDKYQPLGEDQVGLPGEAGRDMILELLSELEKEQESMQESLRRLREMIEGLD